MNYVNVEVNGKSHQLKITFNGMIELQKLTGKSIGELFEKSNIDLSVIRDLYYVALKHSDKTITVEKAGDVIQDFLEESNGIEDVMKPIIEAMQLSGFMGKGIKKTEGK